MRYIKYFLIILPVLLIFLCIIYIIQTLKQQGSIYQIDTTRQAVIKEVKSLNRLETASFTIDKIIDAGKNNQNAFQDFLFGDKILLIAHGQVIAGFDLSQLNEDSIVINNGNVQLTLPKPEIITTTLDNSQTKVYDRSQGILTKGDKDLESKARAAAEESIRQAACQENILTVASDNAKKQLTTLLQSLRFKQITVIIPSGSC